MPGALVTGHFPANIDALHLDIKFGDLQVIREDRSVALQRQILVDHREIKALVRHGGEVYRAKVRLKGDFPDYWKEESRWSLRIELRNDATIWGMSEFSLQKPLVRQYPMDQMFQDVVRSFGNLTPRQTVFRVNVNGVDWGVMSAEEHVSREMIELQGRKESILTKFGNVENRWIYERLNYAENLPYVRYGTFREIQPFDEMRLYANPVSHRLYSYLSLAVLAYMNGQLDYHDVFDVQCYSRSLLAAIVWNNVHTLGNANTRHYLKPYTLRLESITTDQRRGSSLSLQPPKKFSIMWPGSISWIVMPEPFLHLFQVKRFWQQLESNFDAVLVAFTSAHNIFARLDSFFSLGTTPESHVFRG